VPFSVLIVAIIPAIATFVSGSIAIYAWQRREVNGSRAFSLCGASTFIWCFFSVFEYLSMNEAARIIFGKAQYLGISFFAVFWLVFTLRYAQLDGWINRKSLGLLSVIPVLTMVLAVSDPWHGWLWESAVLVRSPYPHLEIVHGWWFNCVMIPQSYALLLSGLGVLLSASFVGSRLYRQQTLILITAALLPFVCNVLYVISDVTLYGLDVTPVGFVGAGVLLQFGLFRTQFLETVPISYKTVFVNTADAVILLDTQCRIVDLNPSAQVEMRQHKVDLRAAIGYGFDQIFPVYSGLFYRALQQGTQCRELTQVIQLPGRLPNKHTGQVQVAYREVKVRSLLSPGERPVGWVIIIRDVTLEKQQQDQLEQFAYVDSLTGLFNRRQLELTFQAPLDDVLMSIALLYIDLNHFKPINDEYGHDVGDEVLKHFAQCLEKSVRQGDMVARLGGDEFVALLYGADRSVALEVRDRLRKHLNRTVTLSGHAFTLSASIGIAYYPRDAQSLHSLLRRADQQMYLEKRLTRPR